MACCCCCCQTPNEGPGLSSTASTPVAGVPESASSPSGEGITSSTAAQIQGESKATIIEQNTFDVIKSLTWFGGSAQPGCVWTTFSNDVQYYYGKDILYGLVVLALIVFLFIAISVKVALE